MIIEGQYAALSINDENKIPKEFSLHDNYPYPFNPVTKIAFDMRIKGDARLIIYNIMGQKIKEYQMKKLAEQLVKLSNKARLIQEQIVDPPTLILTKKKKKEVID